MRWAASFQPAGAFLFMKFRISKEAFLDGLQQVQHVVSTRTTLPILSNVLIEADDEGLRLTTTDLDVGVSGVVKAEVSKPKQRESEGSLTKSRASA